MRRALRPRPSRPVVPDARPGALDGRSRPPSGRRRPGRRNPRRHGALHPDGRARPFPRTRAAPTRGPDRPAIGRLRRPCPRLLHHAPLARPRPRHRTDGLPYRTRLRQGRPRELRPGRGHPAALRRMPPAGRRPGRPAARPRGTRPSGRVLLPPVRRRQRPRGTAGPHLRPGPGRCRTRPGRAHPDQPRGHGSPGVRPSRGRPHPDHAEPSRPRSRNGDLTARPPRRPPCPGHRRAAGRPTAG